MNRKEVIETLDRMATEARTNAFSSVYQEINGQRVTARVTLNRGLAFNIGCETRTGRAALIERLAVRS